MMVAPHGHPLFRIPASAPVPGPERIVIVAHGLSAHRRTHEPEMQRLAGQGFTALSADAPHHGDREDGFLARMRDGDPRKRHLDFLSVVEEWAAETEALIAACHRRGARVGLVGISMGGFLAYSVMARVSPGTLPRPDAGAALIASPDWFRPEAGVPEPGSPLASRSPHRHPDRFFPTPWLTVTAGRDDTVPPEPARTFFTRLRPHYATAPLPSGNPLPRDGTRGSVSAAGVPGGPPAGGPGGAFRQPDRLKECHYPESSHLMRPEDWHDAWDQVIAWFGTHLT